MALTWLCYAVYTRPSVLAKLRAETGRRRSRAYLEATVRESLRMYSVIPNGSGRIAKRAFELGGFDVPAGAMVTVAFHAVHRTLDVFADADTFRPERFLDAKYSPYESIPFGGGTRRCLGMPFAMFELELVLASLIERFDLEIVQRDGQADVARPVPHAEQGTARSRHAGSSSLNTVPPSRRTTRRSPP